MCITEHKKNSVWARYLAFTTSLLFGVSLASAADRVPVEKGSKEAIEEIVVKAHPLSGEGLAQASAVLEGERLAQNVQGNLGATLSGIPGIHSSSFGNALGRPVIHGLSGPRVRIMEDRIDTLDLSVTSADHAVSIDPFVADRIEVLKGSSTLLYGSGAIGGVVDVHTGRIPHVQLKKVVTGRAEYRVDDNAGQETLLFRLDGDVTPFVWHFDAFNRTAGDYHIPGAVESSLFSARNEQEGAPSRNQVRGSVPGSMLDTSGGSVGTSWIWGNGFVGVSASTLKANYGLPGAPVHMDGDATSRLVEERPLLDQQQNRIDVEVGIVNPLRGLDSINFRAGHNNYQHAEIEAVVNLAPNFPTMRGNLELS